MRKWKSYKVPDIENFREHLLQYASEQTQFTFLDSCNNAVYGKPAFDFILAAGNSSSIELNTGNAFERLKKFLNTHEDWAFGYFGYDLKNEIEKLSSVQKDNIQFPDLLFFIPEVIVISAEGVIKTGVLSTDPDLIFKYIADLSITAGTEHNQHKIFNSDLSEEEYIKRVSAIREHIAEGDIYEMNFCRELSCEHAEIHPLHLFRKLCVHSKAPFSVLFRWDEKYLISASPERFLKKTGNKITAQPMKGTIRRGNNKEEDEKLKNELAASEKDRAENVMIVDLVRNDLTKSAETGRIHVDELFGIYSFEHVHQMVSTISAQLKAGIHPVDVIKNAFPPGSMTGAPKVMAMELIEKYEMTKRGLFSGAFGYFTPEKDFDLNVVIRSILYNAKNKFLSIQSGGAIVYDSIAEKELEESLLKAEALMKMINEP